MSSKNQKQLIKTLNNIDFSKNKKELEIKNQILSLFNDAFLINDVEKTINDYLSIRNGEESKIQDELILYEESAIRSYEVAELKNMKELATFKEELESKLEIEEARFNDRRNSINKKIKSKSKQYYDATLNHEKAYDEEYQVIKIEIDEIKNQTRIEQNKIEAKLNKELEEIKKDYLLEETKYNQLLDDNNTLFNNRIAILNNKIDEETIIKDEAYLTIKKTHLNSSVQFNEFINEIKEKYNKQEKDLINEYNIEINEIDLEKEDLEDYFESAKNLISNEYLDKLQALNIVFDVQTNNRNKSNDQINKDNNNEINNINNRLRIQRDHFNSQIEKLKKDRFEELKKTNDANEKEKITISFNKEIKRIENLIRRELKDADLALLNQQKIFHKNQFLQDLESIKHLNEWRYTKNIYDKEREINLLIAEHKIKNDEFILDKNKDFQNQLKNVNLDILRIKNKLELLPIESQLHLSSILQTRDINLLNIEYDSVKLEHNLNVKILENERNLEKLKLNYELDLIKAKYDYDVKTILLKKQLLIEKEIVKRDYEIKKLELNINLQDFLLNLRNNRYSNSIDNEIKLENIKLKNYLEQLNYIKVKDNILVNALTNKKGVTINEIISRNHKLINNKLTQTNISLFKNETNFNNNINTYMFDLLFKKIEVVEQLALLLVDLIEAPSSPKVYNSYISLLIDFNKENEQYCNAMLTELININTNNIENNLKVLINDKYNNKQKEIEKIHEDNVLVSINARKNISSSINYFIEQNKDQEQELKTNTILLATLESNLKDKYNTNQKSFLISENNKLELDIANNKNLIKSLYEQRKPIEANVNRLKLEANKNIKILRKQEQTELKTINSFYRNLIKQYNSLVKLNRDFYASLTALYSQYYSHEGYKKDTELVTYKNSVKNIFSKFNRNNLKHFNNINKFWLNVFNYTRINETLYNKEFTSYIDLNLKNIEKEYVTFENNKTKDLKVLEDNYKNTIKMYDEQVNMINKEKSLTHQSINDIYNNKYQEVLVEIEKLSKESNYKQKVISDNLDSALNNHSKIYTNYINRLENSSRKNQIKLLRDNILIKDDLKENSKNTNLRVNIVSNRHSSDRKKHLEDLNKERKLFMSQINNLYQSIDDLQVNKTKEISKNNVKTRNDIKDEQSVYQQYKLLARKQQRKLLRKERNELRENYRFKNKEMRTMKRRKQK